MQRDLVILYELNGLFQHCHLLGRHFSEHHLFIFICLSELLCSIALWCSPSKLLQFDSVLERNTRIVYGFNKVLGCCKKKEENPFQAIFPGLPMCFCELEDVWHLWQRYFAGLPFSLSKYKHQPQVQQGTAWYTEGRHTCPACRLHSVGCQTEAAFPPGISKCLAFRWSLLMRLNIQ